MLAMAVPCFPTDLPVDKSVRACLPVPPKACLWHDGRRVAAPTQADAD